MGAFVSVMLIVLALIAVVGVMWFVLREQHDPDGHHGYVRSPWRDTHHGHGHDTHEQPAAEPVAQAEGVETPPAPETPVAEKHD